MATEHRHTAIDMAALKAEFAAEEAAKNAELLTMQKTMGARLTTMPPTFTYENYIALCQDVGTPGSESALLPQGDHMFRLYAVPVLPRIFPETTSVHFKVTNDALEMVDAEGLQHLPQTAHGVSIEEILGYVALGVPQLQEGEDRITIADGECTATSHTGIRQLVRAHEKIRPYAHAKRIEPANRKATLGEYYYPGLAPLSHGHTIIGIPYAQDDREMELLIDPTIAQTDRTLDYDIEATAISQAHVPNYLRLRYSSNPNGRVQSYTVQMSRHT